MLNVITCILIIFVIFFLFISLNAYIPNAVGQASCCTVKRKKTIRSKYWKVLYSYVTHFRMHKLPTLLVYIEGVDGGGGGGGGAGAGVGTPHFPPPYPHFPPPFPPLTSPFPPTSLPPFPHFSPPSKLFPPLNQNF